MSDIVEMIPVNEQDEQIYAGWEDGKGLRTLAREFGLSVAQIEQALDRCLPMFNGTNQLLAFKRELRRLEDLSSEFYTIARREKCRDSAHLVARLNERICAMRGWSPVNIRMDPFTTQQAAAPDEYDQIFTAIMRVARGPDWKPPAGNGGELPSLPSMPDDVQQPSGSGPAEPDS